MEEEKEKGIKIIAFIEKAEMKNRMVIYRKLWIKIHTRR